MMFSGGGHLRAAGCSNLPGTIEQVKNQMINRIRSCLKSILSPNGDALLPNRDAPFWVKGALN